MSSITLVQSLLNTQFRLLTRNIWPDEAANSQPMLDLVAALSAQALGQLNKHLASENQPTLTLVELFCFDHLDVTGVKRVPEGPMPVWPATPSGEVARG